MVALIGDYEPVRELDEIERRLIPHAGPATEAAALEYAIELGNPGDAAGRLSIFAKPTEPLASLWPASTIFERSSAPAIFGGSRNGLTILGIRVGFQVLRSARAGIVTCALWGDGYYFTVDIDPILATELPEWPRKTPLASTRSRALYSHPPKHRDCVREFYGSVLYSTGLPKRPLYR